MVRKLTAWKTIAVKDATYAAATKKSVKKKLSTEGYKSATTMGNFQMRHFWWNKTCHDKFSIIILNVFRFLKKLITKWESLNFFESLFRSFALTERLKQACVYSRDNCHLLAGFAHEQILS